MDKSGILYTTTDDALQDGEDGILKNNIKSFVNPASVIDKTSGGKYWDIPEDLRKEVENAKKQIQGGRNSANINRENTDAQKYISTLKVELDNLIAKRNHAGKSKKRKIKKKKSVLISNFPKTRSNHLLKKHSNWNIAKNHIPEITPKKLEETDDYMVEKPLDADIGDLIMETADDFGREDAKKLNIEKGGKKRNIDDSSLATDLFSGIREVSKWVFGQDVVFKLALGIVGGVFAFWSIFAGLGYLK